MKILQVGLHTLLVRRLEHRHVEPGLPKRDLTQFRVGLQDALKQQRLRGILVIGIVERTHCQSPLSCCRGTS